MPAENAGRAFALVLVDELVGHGLRHAVVAPGSRSTPIALALLEHQQVDVHVRIDERSAAYLALGIAAASRAPVAVLCTSGTATTYFHGAVLEADLARVPLLVLTADRPPELHGLGANQTVEQAGMYGGAVRWAPDVPTPEARPGAVADWRMLAATAAGHCLGRYDGPAGPVHLNLPLREPLTATDDGIGFSEDLGLGTSRPVPAAAAFGSTSPVRSAPPAELLSRLAGVERGVVVAGGWNAGSVDSVLDFAGRAGWPVIAEPHSNARRGPNALRSTDALLRDASFVADQRPELVVVVGRVGLSRALLGWLATVPHLVVSPDAGHWDVTGTAQAVINCDAADLDEIVMPPADPGWLRAWHAGSASVSQAIDDVLDESPALTEPRLARDLAGFVPDGAALVVSSSMPIRDLDLVMRPRDGLRVFANRGVSGIDGFVSTAQGVALGRTPADRAPDGPTVALCGDLSLLHDSNGLLPGPDTRPDVTYVVVNNDGGGIFSLLPQGSAVDPASFERLFGTPPGVSIERLAAAYDVPHTTVSTPTELTTALASFRGIRILEVRTNRAENAALHDRLRQITPRTA
jgi:2-succinyl-5-enolpyruvyl-6-hydroxy-3-cyclohexene-1-carboxylate synthase